MVSAFEIRFLCCVALTATAAAAPFPTAKSTSTVKPNTDYIDIVVISIDQPISDSTEIDDGYYSDIFKKLFNFPLPGLPGFGKFIGDDDDLPVDKQSEKRETSIESESGNASPEIHDEHEVTATIVMKGADEDETSLLMDPALNPAMNPAVNIGLSKLLNTLMNNIMTGFIQALSQNEVSEAAPEVATLTSAQGDKPDFKNILADTREPENDATKMEKKIQELLEEVDSSENDLKFGGAQKLPKPHTHSSHNHEFRSIVRNDADQDHSENNENKFKGAIFPSMEQSDLQLERPKNAGQQSDDSSEKLGPISSESGESEIDEKFREIFDSLVEGFWMPPKVFKPVKRTPQDMQPLIAAVITQKATQGTPTLLKNEKSEGSTEYEAPDFESGIVSADKMMQDRDMAQASTIYRLLRQNSDNEPNSVPDSESEENSDTDVYYEYISTPSALDTQLQDESIHSNLMASDYIIVPNPSMRRPPFSYGYGPTGPGFPIMATYPHPFGHHFWPPHADWPSAGYMHPFGQQPMMHPHYFVM